MARAIMIAMAAALLMIGSAQAAEKQKPAGAWNASATVNGEKRDSKLKLKLEGDKLTGTLTTQEGRELKVEDGKFKDDQVTFKLTIGRDGQSMELKFKGKVDGDKIKGKIEFKRDGETESIDWEAKRAKE